MSDSQAELINEESSEKALPEVNYQDDLSVLESTPIERVAELKARIATLPQYRFLDEVRINRWLNFILKVEPARVEWHIDRLRGFGGSEMGVIAGPMWNEFNPFRSPMDVFQDKMMIKLPDGPSGDTRRGTFMEDTIRDIFRAKYDAVEMTDELKLIAKFSDPKHPWLVGNPDDLVRIGDKTYMVDYKCPRPGFKEKYDKHGISFDYFTQLHHYTLIARKQKVPVDGLLLCSFDMVTWDVDVRGVEMKEAMFDVIITAGDWLYFEHILKNTPPKISFAPKVLISDTNERGAKLRDLLDQAAIFSSIANCAYAKDKEVKAEMALLLADQRFGDVKQVHGLMEIVPKTELVPELAVQQLEQLGYVPEDFLLDGGEVNTEKLLALATKAELDIDSCMDKKLDPELVKHVLEMNGIPETSYTEETYRIGLTKSKSPSVKKPLDTLKGVAKDLVEDFLKRNKGVFAPQIAGQEEGPGTKKRPGM